MIYTFSYNPIIRFKCWLANKRLEHADKIWNSGLHNVRCRICNATMSSDECDFSPQNAGWGKIENRRIWICHRCLDHRDFTPYIKQVDQDEEEVWRKIKD